MFTLFAHRVLPARHRAVRHRPARRVRRAASTSRCASGRATSIGAVLERREDAAASSERAPRAVVFAYHDVGVRCLRVLLAHGVEVPLVVTHADAPGREHLVRQRRAPRALARHRGASRRPIPNAPRVRRARRGAARPISCSRSTTARCSAPTLLRAAARAAPTTCTARCCRSTAAARRSTGRCCTASARPAPRCTTWSRSPTPATSSTSRRCRSCRTTPRSRCSAR